MLVSGLFGLCILLWFCELLLFWLVVLVVACICNSVDWLVLNFDVADFMLLYWLLFSWVCLMLVWWLLVYLFVWYLCFVDLVSVVCWLWFVFYCCFELLFCWWFCLFCVVFRFACFWCVVWLWIWCLVDWLACFELTVGILCFGLSGCVYVVLLICLIVRVSCAL